MAQLPILPLKTDALLADTQHLSAEEFGAYCRILFTMWRHEARLPDNATELARIVGVPPRRWATMAERVMRPMTIAEGVISQKRLTSTWLDVQALRKKRAHAANVRHTSKRSADAPAHALQMEATCTANQNQIELIPSSFPTAARETIPISSAGSLASALPSGALARQPDAEQAGEKPPWKLKPATALTREEQEAYFAEKRAKQA